MPIGFGFSVGDFISALTLIQELIQALEDGAGSAKEYQDLIEEMSALDGALLKIKSTSTLDPTTSRNTALDQAACLCQETLSAFHPKFSKYSRSLSSVGSRNRVTDAIRKMQWAVCTKRDIAKFRAQITGRTSPLLMLLAATQEKELRDLKTEITEMKDTGVSVLQTVTRIQQCLPPQIERQQPIHLIDACGEHTCFHLEFINSWEAFEAVLRVRFKNKGLSKICRGEFVIERSATKTVLSRNAPWGRGLPPGSTITMDMVFDWEIQEFNICPVCRYESLESMGVEIDCVSCNTHYSSFVDTSSVRKRLKGNHLGSKQVCRGRDLCFSNGCRSCKDEEEDEEDIVMSWYRRLRLRQSKILPIETEIKSTTENLDSIFTERMDCRQYREHSVSELASKAGFDTFEHFLFSYGLKIWNEDEVEEGSAILHALHDIDVVTK